MDNARIPGTDIAICNNIMRVTPLVEVSVEVQTSFLEPIAYLLVPVHVYPYSSPRVGTRVLTTYPFEMILSRSSPQ